MTNYMIFSRFLAVLLCIALRYVASQGTPGDDDCQVHLGADPEYFRCTNGYQINCSMVDDGRNDCDDNSDEGYLYDCPRRWYDGYLMHQFKCTMHDAEDYGDIAYCTVYHSNDDFDCPDRSDEQKYVGDNCDEGEDLESPVGCWYFMPESYCNQHSECDCLPGRKPIRRGSNCQIRVRGDECNTNSDCSEAYYGLYCNSSMQCDCKVGFYIDSDDRTACRPKRLYENCAEDLECSNPIAHAMCDMSLGVCVCDELYTTNNTTNISCVPRVLGDTCTYNTQCRQGTENCEKQLGFYCNTSHVCDCDVGYHVDTTDSNACLKDCHAYNLEYNTRLNFILEYREPWTDDELVLEKALDGSRQVLTIPTPYWDHDDATLVVSHPNDGTIVRVTRLCVTTRAVKQVVMSFYDINGGQIAQKKSRSSEWCLLNDDIQAVHRIEIQFIRLNHRKDNIFVKKLRIDSCTN